MYKSSHPFKRPPAPFRMPDIRPRSLLGRRAALRATLGATLGLALSAPWPGAARAADAPPIRVAIFPFELDDSSRQGLPTQYQAPAPGDEKRLRMLDAHLRSALVAAGYEPVDLGPVARVAEGQVLRVCNGCEAALALKAGAQISVLGWVQKVSNLILNINLVMRDARTGRMLRAGSVDIRGDTDKSWMRGLDYLLAHRILPKGEGRPR